MLHVSGRGSSHGDATPCFISDSSSHISWLSNEVSFISEFPVVPDIFDKNRQTLEGGLYFFARLYFFGFSAVLFQYPQKLHSGVEG